jgi:Flp pilus assembly protein TadD
MERAIEQGAHAIRLRKQRFMVLGAIVVVMSVPFVLLSWQNPRILSTQASGPLSPYRNTRSDVKYLGDAACARCHAEIAATFGQHPMGRSLAPIGERHTVTSETKDGHPLFESQGLEYSIEERDGRTFHQETRRDAAGQIVTRTEAEVQYVLGSGRQGLAYLIEHDGFLFESPITWFSQKRQWGLSPGFEVANYHFDRPIRPGCLYCHANRALSVPGAINQFRPPIFLGHSIGCERCHGPGELHAKGPAAIDGVGPTIVNPALLEPSLRDAVCEQCHLIGDHRVVRAGRSEEDYRPGLPFERFWTVFLQPREQEENRFVGQVEQMHKSQCFIASRGRLGCISCHDPHKLPAPEEKPAYYRSRCLECHGERGCSLPAESRLARTREDDCTFCHMPRERDSDIPHAASANHRIPRIASAPSSSVRPPMNASRVLRRPVPFHASQADAPLQADLDRDLGVALCRSGEDGSRVAYPLLKRAVRARPDDVFAWEALGLAAGQLGRDDEALAAFGKALAREPSRESTLVGAAYQCMKMGRRQDAAGYWQRAIAKNAWRSEYHAELGLVYFDDGNWTAAAAACRDALRLRASWVEVRKRLVQCYLRMGNADAALAEQESVLGSGPSESR